MTTLYFIRHGQSVANLGQYCAYQLDAPLTELGHHQAACTAEFLKDVPFSAAYASDLRRAYDTAATVVAHLDISVQKRVDLREIYGGKWEGKKFTEVEELYPADYKVWIEQIGLSKPTDGESVAELQKRLKSAVEDIVAHHPGEAVCVATHATAIRVLECLWTGMPLEQMHIVPWTGNASVTIAEYVTPTQVKLVARDLHEHLQNLATKFPKNI